MTIKYYSILMQDKGFIIFRLGKLSFKEHLSISCCTKSHPPEGAG